MYQTRRTRKIPRKRSVTREETYSEPPRRRNRNVWENFDKLALIALEDGEEEVEVKDSNDRNEVNEINEMNAQRRGKRRSKRQRSRSRSQRRRSNFGSTFDDDEYDDLPEENSSDEEYPPRKNKRNMIMHNELKDEDSCENAVTLHHNPYFKNKQQNSSLDVINGKTGGGSSKSRKTLPSKTKNPKSSKTLDYSNAKSKAVVKKIKSSDTDLKSDNSALLFDDKNNSLNSNVPTKILTSVSQNFEPTTSHAAKSKTPEPKHEELPPPHLDNNNNLHP